jgi:hypothetical protein
MFITPPTASAKDDSWALVTLRGSPNSPPLDLKFVQRIHRPYQFSIDSFQIFLDEDDLAPLLSSFNPSLKEIEAHTLVIVQSSYGNISAAIKHLQENQISVQHPGDMAKIHGGGLLKYCSLLARDFTCDPKLDVHKLEAYMCNRFFIDFPLYDLTPMGVPVQMQRVQDFITAHMLTQSDDRKIEFLRVLLKVLRRSAGSQGHHLVAYIISLSPMLAPPKQVDRPLHTSASQPSLSSTRLSYSGIQPIRKEPKKGRKDLTPPLGEPPRQINDNRMNDNSVRRKGSLPNIAAAVVLTQVSGPRRAVPASDSSDNETSSVTSNTSAKETVTVVADAGVLQRPDTLRNPAMLPYAATFLPLSTVSLPASPTRRRTDRL